ncbi:alpha/beta fold hydrolase [Cellulomonas sp. HZM]|uniref:alpha/beta fold hydrolase n=1 Tax=Cellulomonas sp. HZM TaxID=1454010 RepID=UPI0018CC69F9|nr:alpha/beta hydrolase [Cellulomonas sp. HZM]
MRLHVAEHGPATGTRGAAVLLHGMMGSGASWWRLVPLLVARGYRVLALDLPGHGLSDRDPGLTVERAADAVVSTVTRLVDEPPSVAIGHSFGGLVLAAAAPALRPGLAVYVDAPSTTRGGRDRREVLALYEQDRARRTAARLRSTRPHYTARDCLVEGVAAERFDPATAAAVSSAPGGSWPPTAGSVVVRADPSDYVSDEQAAALEHRGVRVRSIPGAAHSVWFSHPRELVASLPEVFGG